MLPPLFPVIASALASSSLYAAAQLLFRGCARAWQAQMSFARHRVAMCTLGHGFWAILATQGCEAVYDLFRDLRAQQLLLRKGVTS